MILFMQHAAIWIKKTSEVKGQHNSVKTVYSTTTTAGMTLQAHRLNMLSDTEYAGRDALDC